jgi:hypothetical protein
VRRVHTKLGTLLLAQCHTRCFLANSKLLTFALRTRLRRCSACRQFLSQRADATKVWIEESIRSAMLPLHPFPTYPNGSTGVFDLTSGRPLAPNEVTHREAIPQPAAEVRISMAADWASGTCESKAVGELMAAEQPHWTLHLGDVYFTGDRNSASLLGAPACSATPHRRRYYRRQRGKLLRRISQRSSAGHRVAQGLSWNMGERGPPCAREWPWPLSIFACAFDGRSDPFALRSDRADRCAD